MKRLIYICLFIITMQYVNAQRNADIGVLFGGAYYMGDINPTRHFYKPSFSYGALMRYNFNQRYAMRISGYFSSLKADPSDFDRNFPDPQPDILSKRVVDLSLQTEFNFLPYITGEKDGRSTIYVAGGIGFAYTNKMSFILPFGIGTKTNLTARLSTGLEWSFRKTFSDSFDAYENPLGRTLFNNNDWYSFFGLFITYKFFKFAADCPAYK